MNQSLLDNISIVLVEPRTPANIGSTARCMMNMGLSRLILVNPLKPVDDAAFKLAAGADAIITQALLAPSPAVAVSDHSLVIGTSRHQGKRRKNMKSPRDLATEVVPLLAQNRIAILFGSEANGLDQAALALCHELVAIPSSAAFPSLNLSHAVMVIAYELFSALQEEHASLSRMLVKSEELEGFYTHLQTTLEAIGFLDREHPERIMLSLRQLCARARPDHRDVRILRGILTAIYAKHRK